MLSLHLYANKQDNGASTWCPSNDNLDLVLYYLALGLTKAIYSMCFSSQILYSIELHRSLNEFLCVCSSFTTISCHQLLFSFFSFSDDLTLFNFLWIIFDFIQIEHPFYLFHSARHYWNLTEFLWTSFNLHSCRYLDISGTQTAGY